jgi:predicted dehydrogenase
MRFALLGDHPDGLDMAHALVESGRHELAVYAGPQAGADRLDRWGLICRTVPDAEEVLANPDVDAVIVAGKPAERPDQLRRALQSERHVLCVQPVDTSPDTAYEAALIQGDTRQVLLPLLPEGLHPGVRRLAELARSAFGKDRARLVEMERWSTDQALLEGGARRRKTSLPGWDVLRVLGGEVAEVLAFTSREAIAADEPLLLMGRFEEGGLFQASFLSGQQEPRWRLGIVSRLGRADLFFPQGWPGAARLTWRNEAGEDCTEEYALWNPWPPLVEVFEDALAQNEGSGVGKFGESHQASEAQVARHLHSSPLARATPRLTWQDAVRLLELDDAARRSAEKRRASTLEYQEASEEAGFKGLMTLFGCGLLWASLILVIVSHWLPWAGWLIPPLFGVFLLMQLLRWGARKPGGGATV